MNKIKRIASILLAVILSVVALAGCGGNNEAKDNSKKEMQELTVGLMPDIDSVPLIIAIPIPAAPARFRSP